MRYIPLYEKGDGVSEKTIRNSFVANRHILDLLVKNISAEKTDSIPQPIIIIGSEGTGKTWLLKALELRISNDLTDFHVVVPDPLSMSSINSFISIIKEEANSHKGRPVVLVDDLDRVLGAMSNEEQYLFRGMLSKSGAPILVGSSSVVPKALTDYNAAFFDDFAIINIGNLSVKQALDMLKIDSDKNETRALNLLSILGTSVRKIQLACNIMSMSKSKDDDEQILFDFLYDSMATKLNSLPDISQRIIIATALSENGLRLTELSERLNIDGNRLSSYTFKLYKLHILKKEVQKVRNAKYTIADKKLLFFIRSRYM